MRGTWGLRYCGIELVFKRYFGNLILMCSIAVSSCPVVYGFSSFWLTVFGKGRSFMVLQYHLLALSCLIRVNTMCNMNNSKVNRLIKLLFAAVPRIAANYCFHSSSLLTAVTETHV